MLTSLHDWFIIKRKVHEKDIKLRLFLFPPAGGDISTYQHWEESLPPYLETCFVRLPGRGGRIEAPLIPDSRVLIDEIVNAMSDYLDKPYIMFGHSMGGFLIYEAAVRLLEMNKRLPERLFISGSKAPAYVNQNDSHEEVLLHLLEDEELKDQMLQFGGIPDIIKENDTYLDMMLPIFRNDLKLCDTYHSEHKVRVPVDIDIFGGTSDFIAGREDLEHWREYSEKTVTITVFPGNHFYFNDRLPSFLFELSRRILEIKERIT